MRSPITSNHWNDGDGNPAGGTTFGNGFAIGWQNGPLGRGENRRPPNGAFVEDIIAAATERLMWYQESRFACDENERAIEALDAALAILEDRTKDRETRTVEGLYVA